MGGQRAGQITPARSSFASRASHRHNATHHRSHRVDPYNAIPEADEADNSASQEVDVAALRAQPMEVTVMR